MVFFSVIVHSITVPVARLGQQTLTLTLTRTRSINWKSATNLHTSLGVFNHSFSPPFTPTGGLSRRGSFSFADPKSPASSISNDVEAQLDKQDQSHRSRIMFKDNMANADADADAIIEANEDDNASLSTLEDPGPIEETAMAFVEGEKVVIENSQGIVKFASPKKWRKK